MKNGYMTVGNLSQFSTGYIRIANGTTAQRPAAPTDGMIRLNKTKGIYEFYLNGTWVTFLQANADNQIISDIGTYQIPNVSGMLSEPMMFIEDVTRNNKMLSVAGNIYSWSSNYINNDDWIMLPNIYTSEAGFVMPYDGTITGITSYTAEANYHTKSFSVWVNNVENKEAHYINGLNTDKSVKTVSTNNIDFTRGSNIRLQARTPANYSGFYMGGIQYVTFAMQVKWRYAG
jgi:hypothetical protein